MFQLNVIDEMEKEMSESGKDLKKHASEHGESEATTGDDNESSQFDIFDIVHLDEYDTYLLQ